MSLRSLSTHHMSLLDRAENMPLSSTLCGFKMTSSIYEIGCRYGDVVTFKAYVEMLSSPLTPRPTTFKTELLEAGVTLMECPHKDQKEGRHVFSRAARVHCLREFVRAMQQRISLS